MNKENARDYLPLVQALAEGKTIQAKLHHATKKPTWEDDNNPIFRFEPCQYRIKPEPKKQWYRVAMMRNSYTKTVKIYTLTIDDEAEEKTIQDHPDFVSWLTDRIEYTLPEGDE